MPRTVERKASGVGTHVWKKEEYQAKKALEGRQKSSEVRGMVECMPPSREGEEAVIVVGGNENIARTLVIACRTD